MTLAAIPRVTLAAALTAVFVLNALGPADCIAQIPQKLNYQVMLTDDLDQPLANQTVEMVFTIYDADSGGSALWTETQNVTTNSVGVVSVLLGDVNPIDFEITGPIWLDVAVDGETLSPRRELATSPYAAWAARADDAAMLGGNEAHEYVLADDLDGPGTVNDPSNPVDWNVLFDVPAGFADGTDDVGGAGDGHSLDASDGSPTDALYVDAEGNVGIGTTSPQSELHVSETAEIGSNSTQGMLTVHGGHGTDSVVRLSGDGLGNGSVVLSSGGLAYATVGKASGSSGGKLWLSKNAVGSNGIWLDANYANTGAGRLDINGVDLDHTIQLNMSLEGDGSVILPANAIGTHEIVDDPGVTSLLSTGSITLGESPTSLGIRSLTAPGSGYILAIGTAEIWLSHTYNISNNVTSAQIGLTDDFPNYASSQSSKIQVPDRVASGTYRHIVTVHGVFNATSGLTKTIRMYGQNLVAGNSYAMNVHITLLFIPDNDYGTVQTIDASAVSGGAPGYDSTEETSSQAQGAERAAPGSTGSSEPAQIAMEEGTVEIPRTLLQNLLERVDRLERAREQK